jgi:hypothetical protein
MRGKGSTQFRRTGNFRVGSHLNTGSVGRFKPVEGGGDGAMPVAQEVAVLS